MSDRNCAMTSARLESVRNSMKAKKMDENRRKIAEIHEKITKFSNLSTESDFGHRFFEFSDSPNTSDAFPYVPGSVRKHLRKIHQEYFSLSRFQRVYAGQKESIAMRFPAETLDLIDLVVSEDSREIRFDLGEMLAQISGKRAELARDRKFLRLQGLLAAR